MRPLLVAILVLACATNAKSGDYCYRSRNIYHADTYSYSYHAAGWYQNRWFPAGNYAWINGHWHLQGYGIHYGYDHPTYEKVKIVYKEVEPDFYASTRDYYRDSLFADAIAYRVLTAQAKGAAAPVQAQPIPPYGQEKEPPQRVRQQAARTEVSPVLAKYVSENCLKCHTGPAGKGGVDLSALETVPVGVRWACHGTVSAGEMPKGGKEAPDAIVKEFFDWSKAASAKTQSNNQSSKGGNDEETPALPGDRRGATVRRDER